MSSIANNILSPFQDWVDTDLRGISLTSNQKWWLGYQIYSENATVLELVEIYQLSATTFKRYAKVSVRMVSSIERPEGRLSVLIQT